jgi:hypothetical protein
MILEARIPPALSICDLDEASGGAATLRIVAVLAS